MKLICEAAPSTGIPGDSLLLLFTKSAWLTKRAIFAQIRRQMLGCFEDIAGVLVKGPEFFDVKGAWPPRHAGLTVSGRRRRRKRGIRVGGWCGSSAFLLGA